MKLNKAIDELDYENNIYIYIKIVFKKGIPRLL